MGEGGAGAESLIKAVIIMAKINREQTEMEYKSRREYSKKFSKSLKDTPWNEMYNQNEINKQLKKDGTDYKQFTYSNGGESYFVSQEMYNSLMAVCRCGRPRSGLHLLRCLQNPVNKYLKDIKKDEDFKKLPKTASGFVGWQHQQPSYKQWEYSMKYISPVYDMPGGKITAPAYNAIIIG